MAVYTTIDDPEAYFQAVEYTGNYTGGGSTQDITLPGDTDMQPDFVWIKSTKAEKHCLYDAVRGATKTLSADSINAESTDAGFMTAFNSDGFSVGAANDTNENATAIAAWCWKAGTTSGITTDGDTTITPSSYSFNQTSGFSILRYTGNSTDDARLAHGLGGAAEFLVCKEKDVAANNWAAWHSALGNNVMALDDNPGAVAGNSRFSNNPPDAVNITLGSDNSTNRSGNMLCYAFKGVQGFSKFGQYEGNGNADGPFVYTGFRPAYILIKNTEAAKNWQIYDNKRSGYNKDNDQLFANTTAAEDTAEDALDILSNGFKLRVNSDPVNLSGDVMIYAAFAEAPFVNSNGVPCNAR